MNIWWLFPDIDIFVWTCWIVFLNLFIFMIYKINTSVDYPCKDFVEARLLFSGIISSILLLQQYLSRNVDTFFYKDDVKFFITDPCYQIISSLLMAYFFLEVLCYVRRYEQMLLDFTGRSDRRFEALRVFGFGVISFIALQLFHPFMFYYQRFRKQDHLAKKSYYDKPDEYQPSTTFDEIIKWYGVFLIFFGLYIFKHLLEIWIDAPIVKKWNTYRFYITCQICFYLENWIIFDTVTFVTPLIFYIFLHLPGIQDSYVLSFLLTIRFPIIIWIHYIKHIKSLSLFQFETGKTTCLTNVYNKFPRIQMLAEYLFMDEYSYGIDIQEYNVKQEEPILPNNIPTPFVQEEVHPIVEKVVEPVRLYSAAKPACHGDHVNGVCIRRPIPMPLPIQKGKGRRK